MFAPVGYVTLAKLWREFQREHGGVLCDAARALYGVKSGVRYLDFGSPADFVEDAFIKSFDTFTFSLCSPSALILTAQPKDPNNSFRLLDRLNVIESTIAITDKSEKDRNLQRLKSLGSYRFEPWLDELGKASTWASEYCEGRHATTPPGDLPYHTLPLTFERHRFLVSDPLPPWSEDALDMLFVRRILPEGQGCAVCLDVEQESDWRATTLRRSWSRKIIDADGTASKTGRPEKKAAALRYYRRLYPQGHDGTWKQVVRSIEEEFRFVVSVKTLRRAIEEDM